MNSIVERAKDLAHRAHAGQVDKAGRPYIEHVRRVAAMVRGDDIAEAVAWVHDVLEDCRHMPEWLEVMEFQPQVVAVNALHLSREVLKDTNEYYANIRRHSLALRVKLADIEDNKNEERLALLDTKTADRLRRKYAKALRLLIGGGEDES